MAGSSLPPVVEAMLAPSFYPARPEQVELVETHISWVLLVGPLAYKVRKPVVFPFLDYGTAERRRQMAEEEVRLGRRLAPEVYLGVRAIVARPGGGFALADADAADAVEHAVEMRRVDQRRTLATLLARGEAKADDIRRIARRLASFHAAAERAPAGTFVASAVAATVDENFSTLLPHADELGPRALARGHRFAVAFLHRNRELLERRAAGGCVRDVHGDLRAQHVIVDEQIQVFDPVEFEPALRRIDVAADLAFLVMDLHAAAAPELADILVAEYAAAGGDNGGDALLSFYAAYRAWVRAKVACLRAHELAPGVEREEALAEARRYATLGGRLAWRARCPLVLIVCGRAATGKSLLARELAGRSTLPVLSSDLVRKELAGIEPQERAPEREYSEAASLRVYRALGARAAAAAHAGGAIVDATFRRRAHRDAFADGYASAQPAPLFVECTAPETVLAERAHGREDEPGRVSDAGPAIVARQAGELDPLDEVAAERHLLLRTDRPPDEAADGVEAWLDELLLPPCL